jgi:hypothetical protein
MTQASKPMKKAIGIVLLAGLPALAHAQAPTQVPAIMQGSADAAVTVTGSATSGGEPAAAKSPAPVNTGAEEAGVPGASKAAGPVPAHMPPSVQLVSPSAPLDAKERHAVILARRWRNRREMPQPGDDGVVRYLFGATLPTVVSIDDRTEASRFFVRNSRGGLQAGGPFMVRQNAEASR